MRRLGFIWEDWPEGVSYPGITQTGNTSVLVSIGGAINHLTNSTLTEQHVQDLTSGHQPGFPEPILNFPEPILSSFSQLNVEFRRFLDNKESPSVDQVINYVSSGAVLIVSFKIKNRHFNHTLTFFHSNGDYFVWDSDGRCGTTNESDLRKILQVPDYEIFRPRGRDLTADHKHEALIVSEPPRDHHLIMVATGSR